MTWATIVLPDCPPPKAASDLPVWNAAHACAQRSSRHVVGSDIAVQRLLNLMFGNPSHNLLRSAEAARRALLSRIGCATISRSVFLHQTKFVSRTFSNKYHAQPPGCIGE